MSMRYCIGSRDARATSISNVRPPSCMGTLITGRDAQCPEEERTTRVSLTRWSLTVMVDSRSS
jgi:hypothetical protein